MNSERLSQKSDISRGTWLELCNFGEGYLDFNFKSEGLPMFWIIALLITQNCVLKYIFGVFIVSCALL